MLGDLQFAGYVPAMSNQHHRAVFGASCYWGAEASFRAVNGVTETAVGFMADSLCDTGGPSSDQQAKALCMVEVVQVDYDPGLVSYAQLLNTFWDCHDAARDTHRPEDGRPSLERSVLFVSDDEQRQIAESARAHVRASNRFSSPVTTTIETVGPFHRADESEQRYFERNEGVVCSAKLSAINADAAE